MYTHSKNFLISLIAILLCCLSVIQAQSKQQLSVLYVSGTKDYLRGTPLTDTAARAEDFRSLLDRYFSEVKTVRDVEFTAAQAKEFDVIVVDGNIMGRVPAGFGRPMVLVGTDFPPLLLAAELGSKLQHRCRCLQGDKLHSVRSDHPIFKGPLPVTPTLTDDIDPVTNRLVRVWKAHEPLWWDGKDKWGFDVGSVADGPLLLEAGDSEIISGGVNSFGDHAVALARETNFFHWGPAAPPSKMTEEAQRVFVNTVVYMKQFDGAKRTVWRGTPTQREMLLRFSESFMKIFRDRDHDGKVQIIRGMFPAQLVDRLGYDLEKYRQIYVPNAAFVYVPHGTNTYVIDEDARSIGLPNNDIRFLEKCIALVNQPAEAAKAKRLLERYTGLSFPSAQAWKQWLDADRDKLYFSDYYDYRFYSGPAAPAPPNGEVQRAIWEMKLEKSRPPLMSAAFFGAVAVGYSKGGKDAAKQKDVYMTDKGALATLVVRLKPYFAAWVYKQAPAGTSAEPVKIEVDLPPGAHWNGDWQLPEPRTDITNGGQEYGGDIVFKRNFYVTTMPDGESGNEETTLSLRGNLHFQLFDSFRSSDPIDVPFETKIIVRNR